MAKKTKLLCPTGKDAYVLRKKLGINQSQFWNRLHVTQSGGSRYESGRDMPEQLSILLHLVYGSDKQAQELLDLLRKSGE